LCETVLLAEEEEAKDEEVAESEDGPDLILGIEKPVLIRLAMMSALTLVLNLALPKPSAVAERQAQKQAANQTTQEDASALVAEPEEAEDDDVEVFEEADDDDDLIVEDEEEDVVDDEPVAA